MPRGMAKKKGVHSSPSMLLTSSTKLKRISLSLAVARSAAACIAARNLQRQFTVISYATANLEQRQNFKNFFFYLLNPAG